jgi:hypothetical protein
MPGKPFVVTAENFDPKKIKIGKVDSKKDIPNAKFSRAAIGYEGMPSSHITCIPKGGKKRRDASNSLHVVIRGGIDPETNKPNGLYSTGVYHTYTYQKPRIPENINGYQLQTCLVKKDNIGDPDDDDKTVLNVFEGLTEAVRDWVVENKDQLPIAFQSLSDKKLRKCVQPLHQPKTEKDGTTYGETFWCKIGYWKANEWNGKKFPERFTTPFKGPGNVKLDPKKLVGSHGHVVAAVKLNHLNFMIGDDADDMKIKIDSELADVNFTPTSREESNLCGDNPDDGGGLLGDMAAEAEGYGDVDHTKEYGDGASNSYGESEGQDDSSNEETSEERRKRKKKEKKAKKKNKD